MVNMCRGVAGVSPPARQEKRRPPLPALYAYQQPQRETGSDHCANQRMEDPRPDHDRDPQDDGKEPPSSLPTVIVAHGASSPAAASNLSRSSMAKTRRTCPSSMAFS